MDLSNCLLPDRKVEPISPGLWSAIAAADRSDSYDKMARVYDWLVGNSLYNRIVWGSWASTYTDTAARELQLVTDSPIIDVGCGSLVFTSGPYQSAPLDRMIMFDRSLGMMRRGQSRLPGGHFIQGDAFDMPFQNDVFGHVFAWGFLHVVGSKSLLLSELRRVALPGAAIALSTLVLSDRPVGNHMLRLLHRKGEASEPESAGDVIKAFEQYFTVTRKVQHGSMLFLNGRADV